MSYPDSDDERRSAEAAQRPASFEDIVAGWLAEGTVPDWPAEAAGPAGAPEAAAPATPVAVPPPPPPPAAAAPRPPEEEHFIPPDPPPLPHLGPPAIVGLTLLVLGIILAVTPQVVGLNESAGLPLGLLTLALGLGWLVLRSWPTDEPDAQDDDGAVL